MVAMHDVDVDPSNREQLRAWDGDEGAYWAAHADHFERTLDGYDEATFAAASIDPHDRVLDIGCGTGKTTRDAARLAPKGFVLGVDLSSAMVEVARRRAADASLSNVRFEQADAQIHPFEPAGFDLALGRTSVMFFGDRVAGLANVAKALRSGGRLVVLTWQPFEHQEWIRSFSHALRGDQAAPTPGGDAPGPFTMADPAAITDVLDAAGYVDIDTEGHRAPMWFGHDAEDAFGFVVGLHSWLLETMNDEARSRALEALRTTIAAHATPAGVSFDSAVWLTRARRP